MRTPSASLWAPPLREDIRRGRRSALPAWSPRARVSGSTTHRAEAASALAPAQASRGVSAFRSTCERVPGDRGCWTRGWGDDGCGGRARTGGASHLLVLRVDLRRVGPGPARQPPGGRCVPRVCAVAAPARALWRRRTPAHPICGPAPRAGRGSGRGDACWSAGLADHRASAAAPGPAPAVSAADNPGDSLGTLTRRCARVA